MKPAIWDAMMLYPVLCWVKQIGASFHPESALFPPWSRQGGINLRVFLCGVPMYASAQTLDFLHLSVRRWAIRKWRDAKLYAPRRKCLLSELETLKYLIRGFRMDTN
jgi:hypothetical protein